MNAHAGVRGGLVRSVSVACLALAALVAACSTGSASTVPPASMAPPPTPPVGGAVIVAENFHFDRSRLDLPAGVSVPLLFQNRDAALHNVAIVDATGGSMFAGEVFGGPGERTYTIPALAAGTYSFHCGVHPEMNGTLVAGTTRS